MSAASDQCRMLYKGGRVVTAVKDYIITVIAAASLCAVITHFVGNKGTAAAIIKLLTGLFMATALLRPVVHVQITEFVSFAEDIKNEANRITESGKKAAQEQMESIIISRSQAYILDKAASLGIDIDAEIYLEDYIPASVRVTGAVSPYAKARLSSYIEETLGIPTEAQEWIGYQ